MTLSAQPVARIEESPVALEYLTAERHGSDPERYLSQDQEGRTRPGLLRHGERGQASPFRTVGLLARFGSVLLFVYSSISLMALQSTSDSRLVYQVRSERHSVSVTHIEASWAALSGS